METEMHTSRETGNADGLNAVRMYPNNRLKEQVRQLGQNLSAFAVMKEAFKA